jgi:hypothetical protein
MAQHESSTMITNRMSSGPSAEVEVRSASSPRLSCGCMRSRWLAQAHCSFRCLGLVRCCTPGGGGSVRCPTALCPADGCCSCHPCPKCHTICEGGPSWWSRLYIRETWQNSAQRSRRCENWDRSSTPSQRYQRPDWRSCIWTHPDQLPAAATACCSTTYRRQRSTRLSPVPVTDRDRRCCRWSYATSVVPLPSDPRTQARSVTLTPNSPCLPLESRPTWPPLRRSMHTCGLLSKRSLLWSASIHYANFDDRPDEGRDRFHDRATLERLRVVKSRVDPTGVFTCGHPITGSAAPAPKSLVRIVPRGSH